ncbi:uncharacterized protein LOC126835925 isoform X3 [Adelges cooleyi]|uniref:uncharacterized protein LOC126835925 isoform X3 n=1 Tax=Adelges cooleyi TaxID=133065 RepID=UPI0021800349|nr:uncharacterized protein LOC126835925 isoform X3 [Adelges cooleyi]
MELLCILISLALVNNLVAALDEYHKQVIMTNQHIQRAGVRLPEIIRNIVRRPSSMKKMAFMLAVPESENANIEEKLLYQSCMQTEIIAATGIDVPVLPETAEGDFENFDLSDFGRTRRNMTSAAVKALIRSQIRGDTNFSVNFTEYHLCSLIGLFKSIQHPPFYVDIACVDINGTCFLMDVNRNISRYRSIDGSIWEINADFTPFQPLSFQVQF